MKLFTFQSKYYHNEHSNQRDRFLIEQFGEEWLKNMKNKGHFQGDWPDDIIGTLKQGDWKSKSFDKDGNIFENTEINIDTEEGKKKLQRIKDAGSS